MSLHLIRTLNHSRETGDLLVQDPITNGYILSYIGLVAERVNYGAEYCTAKKPDPITCGVKEYSRVLNEYSLFQVCHKFTLHIRYVL